MFGAAGDNDHQPTSSSSSESRFWFGAIGLATIGQDDVMALIMAKGLDDSDSGRDDVLHREEDDGGEYDGDDDDDGDDDANDAPMTMVMMGFLLFSNQSAGRSGRVLLAVATTPAS